MDIPYQPFYCEENAYHICRLLASADSPADWSAESFDFEQTDNAAAIDAVAMLFIFSTGRWVAVHRQKAAPPGRPVYWDYHVVALARMSAVWRVYDPDSELPLGIAATEYFENAFPVSSEVRVRNGDPIFRWVDWSVAESDFASDRRHMKDGDTWREPPPPWPAINAERHRLPEYVSPRDNGIGRVLTLSQLKEAVQTAPA